MQKDRGKQQNGKEQRSLQERDTKGTFHAKMGSIKDRKGKDLTEAEDIKKSGKEYTEELYKECLNDTDNHDGAVIHHLRVHHRAGHLRV